MRKLKCFWKWSSKCCRNCLFKVNVSMFTYITYMLLLVRIERLLSVLHLVVIPRLNLSHRYRCLCVFQWYIRERFLVESKFTKNICFTRFLVFSYEHINLTRMMKRLMMDGAVLKCSKWSKGSQYFIILLLFISQESWSMWLMDDWCVVITKFC